MEGGVEHIHKSRLHTEVSRQKANDLNAGIIPVRSGDINAGDSGNPRYRSRLVARGIKQSVRPDFPAATPPSEALTVIRSLLRSGDMGEKLMANDVGRGILSRQSPKASVRRIAGGRQR